MVTKESKYLSCADTAKLVRSAISKSFPGVKFSVRSKTYSGGASIDISWTDGPRQKVVEAIANQYEGRRFDGMIDLAYGVDHYLKTDGTVMLRHDPGTGSSRGSNPEQDNRNLDSVMPDNIQVVHLGANYVFCSRQISDYDRKYAEVVKWLYAHLIMDGTTTGDPNQDRFGDRWLTDHARRMVQNWQDGEDLQVNFDRPTWE